MTSYRCYYISLVQQLVQLNLSRQCNNKENGFSYSHVYKKYVVKSWWHKTCYRHWWRTNGIGNCSGKFDWNFVAVKQRVCFYKKSFYCSHSSVCFSHHQMYVEFNIHFLSLNVFILSSQSFIMYNQIIFFLIFGPNWTLQCTRTCGCRCET